MSNERDQAQTSFNAVTNERDQLINERNQLIKAIDQMKTNYDTMTKVRDQFQLCARWVVLYLKKESERVNSHWFTILESINNWKEISFQYVAQKPGVISYIVFTW